MTRFYSQYPLSKPGLQKFIKAFSWPGSFLEVLMPHYHLLTYRLLGLQEASRLTSTPRLPVQSTKVENLDMRSLSPTEVLWTSPTLLLLRE